MSSLQYIDIELIKSSPYQGRFVVKSDNLNHKQQKKFKELKSSIEKNGLVHPVILVEREGNFILIDGHRRLEALKALGRQKVFALVRNVSEKQEQAMSITANLQRADLNNIEKAFAFRKVLDSGFFADKRELSKAIGKDETYVGDILNLLNLDKRIIDDLLKNETLNDVRLLRMIRKVEPVNDKGFSKKQYTLYTKVVREKLNRSQVQALIDSAAGQEKNIFEIKGSARRKVIKINKLLTPQQQQQLDKLLEKVLKQFLE